MVGLEYAPNYINALGRGHMLSLKEKYKNDGRMFFIVMKLKCYESVYGYIVTDKDIISKLASDVGVTSRKLIEMVVYSCTEAKDYGLDENNNPVRIPFLDKELWDEHGIICCKEWLFDIVEKNNRSEKGRARNRLNKQAQRDRERKNKEVEDGTIYGI